MIRQALDWFDGFTADYRMDDPVDNARLDLKRDHCLHVMDEARAQAQELDLDDRLVELATVAGLYHDLGRFPQYRRYRTFRDSDSANHGRLGVLALTRRRGLRWLSPQDRHLVRLAVGVHNRRELPGAVASRNGPTGLLARIVRDADKLDICRVMVEHFKTPGLKDPVVFLSRPDIPDRFNPEMIDAIDAGRAGCYEVMTSTNDFALLLLSWINVVSFARTRRRFYELGFVEDLFAVLPDQPEISALASRYHARHAPRPTGD
jgi:hypothetical protein